MTVPLEGTRVCDVIEAGVIIAKTSLKDADSELGSDSVWSKRRLEVLCLLSNYCTDVASQFWQSKDDYFTEKWALKYGQMLWLKLLASPPADPNILYWSVQSWTQS